MALPTLFDPIVNAPRSQKLVFGVVGLVAILGAAYFFLLSPVQARLGMLRAKQESLQRELAQSRAIVADIARYRREIAELEKRLALLQERLPTEKEMPPLYRTLSDAATAAGLEVALFQPRDPRIRDYYSEVPITINAHGGYHHIGEFFERVAKLPRVVNLIDMKLSGQTKSKHPLISEITLATYMYRPVGSPPAPKPGAPAGQPGTPAARPGAR